MASNNAQSVTSSVRGRTVNTKKGNVTKVEVFQELIRKLLHKEVELEEVNGVGTKGTFGDSKTEKQKP